MPVNRSTETGQVLVMELPGTDCGSVEFRCHDAGGFVIEIDQGELSTDGPSSHATSSVFLLDSQVEHLRTWLNDRFKPPVVEADDSFVTLDRNGNKRLLEAGVVKLGTAEEQFDSGMWDGFDPYSDFARRAIDRMGLKTALKSDEAPDPRLGEKERQTGIHPMLAAPYTTKEFYVYRWNVEQKMLYCRDLTSAGETVAHPPRGEVLFRCRHAMQAVEFRKKALAARTMMDVYYEYEWAVGDNVIWPHDSRPIQES